MKNFKILIILILFTLPAKARVQNICNEYTGQCEQVNIRITDNEDGTYRLRGINYSTNSNIYSNRMRLRGNKLEGYIQDLNVDNNRYNDLYRFKIREID